MSLRSFDMLERIPNREEALAAIIASIAMEEAALASIMEAESKKLRHAVKNMKSGSCEDMCMLLRFNESVDSVVGRIVDMNILLKNKLQLALGHLPKPPHPSCPPKPPKPPHPPKPPCRKCSAVFLACNKYMWSSGRTLILEEDRCYKHLNICCIKTERRYGDTFIVLPSEDEFKVEIEFILLNPCKKPVSVELRHERSGAVLFSKEYSFEGKECKVEIRDVLDLRSPRESQLSFKLLSEKGLAFERAVVKLASIQSVPTFDGI